MNNIDVSTTKGEALNCLEQDQEATAYIDGLDLADTYSRIVSCYTSQSRNAGGGRNSPNSTPKRPRTYQSIKANARVYNGFYALREGQGRQGSPYCGKTLSVSACENKDCTQSKNEIRKCSCHRHDCPICYQDAAERQAKSSTDRLASFKRDFYQEFGERPGREKHFVFSPTPKKWPRERIIGDNRQAYDRELKKLCDFAFKDGFYALESIFHGEREKHKDGTDCPGKDCELPASEHVWIWSVHTHAVGYGFLKSIHEINRKFPQWNIMVLEEKDGRERNVHDTVFYQMTHATNLYHDDTNKQSKKAVKHLGLSNPRAYRRTLDHLEYERIKCLCGQSMKVYLPTNDDAPDRSMDLGPYIKKKEVFTYKFNHNALTKFFRKREETRAYEYSNEGIRKRAREIKEAFHEATPEIDLKQERSE